MSPLSDEVTGLFSAAAGVDAAQWGQAIETHRAIRAPYRAARKASKPSASELAAVQKSLLATLRPHADRIREAGEGAFMDVTLLVENGAYAMLKRSSLTEDDFETLVAPLRAAGISSAVLDATSA
ncbi:hypothetical protein [Microbacterium sp. P01]|uniref:hypothetical protein n=1 Tax=unclassified Microbacterium TaxID=2609290 RepID=UPI00366B511E